MIDYRDELDFRKSLVLFFADNFSFNNNEKPILTLQKLKVLTIAALTPNKLASISYKLNGIKLAGITELLYDRSLVLEYPNELNSISKLIVSMINLNYLTLQKHDDYYVSVGEIDNHFLVSVNQDIPSYLSANKSKIKKLLGKSEQQLIRALMEP